MAGPNYGLIDNALVNKNRAVEGYGAVNQLIAQNLENQQNRMAIENAVAERAAGEASGGDLKQYQQNMMKVNPGAGIKVAKSISEINKFDTETINGRLKASAQMSDLAQTPAEMAEIIKGDHMDPVLGTFYSQRGLTPEKTLGMLNEASKTPEGFRQFKMSRVMGLKGMYDQLNSEGQLKVSQGQLGVAQGNLAETRRAHDLQYGENVVANTVTDNQGNVTQFNRYGQVIGTPGKIGKVSGSAAKSSESIDQQRATIQGALDAVKNSPSAFGFSRGALGETIGARMSTEQEIEDRSYLFNTISGVIKERAGTAQSSGERATLNRFLPLPTDNAEIITGKLKAFDKYLTDKQDALTGTPKVPKELAVNIPQGAIDALKSGKGTDEQFDAIFGKGAAAKVKGK